MAQAGHSIGGRGAAAIIFVRLAVGGVFFSEGVQKFLFPEALGIGRFGEIGIPAPGVMAPFVGIVEIGCGILLIIGLCTRLASVPLIADMLVAITTTKIPILLKSGFWAMAHEARVDYTMLLGCLFLLLAGGGAWSLDGQRTGDRKPRTSPEDAASGNEL
jgi:putative oxidoreductase